MMPDIAASPKIIDRPLIRFNYPIIGVVWQGSYNTGTIVHTVMNRTDFATVAQKTLSEHIENPPKDTLVRVVRMTSGTSDAPLVFIRELPPKPPGWFTNAEHPMLCGGSLPWRLGLVLFFKCDTDKESPLLLLDSSDMSGSLSGLLHDFSPDVLVGFPSVLSQVATYLGRPHGTRIQSLVMTGESLTSSIRGLFESFFPQAILRMQYLIQELGYVGSPVYCPYLPVAHYHPAEGVSLDIFDPDETGAGELMVSSHFNKHIVLDHYRYGDLARLYNTPCICGARSSFEILGRSGYDFVRMMGATLRREELDRVLQNFSVVADYRAVVALEYTEGRPFGHIEISLLGPSGVVLEQIATALRKELFLTPTQTLGDLIDKGLFLPPTLLLVTQPFPSKHKDIKLTQRV